MSENTSKKDHVRAIVRFRPPMDADEAGQSCWDIDKEQRTVRWGGDTSGALAVDKASTHAYNAVYVGTDRNDTVFKESIQPIVDDCIDGKNACVLCYGQTGSGKTHTMFGYSNEDPGFVPQAIDHMFKRFALMKRSTRFRMAVSFYEIYNESLNDLLATSSGTNLAVREVNNTAYVEGLNIRMCHDVASVMKVIEYGTLNKTVGNSYLHDKSSRAHTVFTLQIATEKRAKDVISTQVSRINFVDLAGSEMLSHQFGDQQQKETKAINLSLLSLRNVISALASKEQFIPFRDSVLTRLLAPSLSENSVTAMLCTCSPATQHATLTNGTLKFGNVSRMIEQKAQLNEFIREGSKKHKIKETADEETVKVGEKTKKSGTDATTVETMDADASMTPCVFDTRQGPVNGFCVLPTSGSAIEAAGKGPKKVALCLHAFGTGCSGGDWEEVMRSLAQLGYSCYSVDFPGFGKTRGTRQASRSDKLDDVGGPLEIVYDMLDNITERSKKVKVLLVGWDWGANMCLVLAQGPFKTRVSGLILYHPSYTNKLEELAKVTLPVLLCWIPTDQLHLYSTGKRMARIMPKSKLVTLQTQAGKDRNYDDVWAVMCATIFKWVPANISSGSVATKAKPSLTRKPSPPPQAAQSPPPEPSASSSDDDDNIEVDSDDEVLTTESSFLACILCDPMAAAAVVEGKTQKRTKTKKQLRSEAGPELAATTPAPSDELQKTHWYVEQLRTVLGDERKVWMVRDALQRRNNMGAMFSQAVGLVGGLPVILPFTKATELQYLGLWPAIPRGNASAFPRYAPGRQVFVPASNVVANFTNPLFGRYDSKGSKCLSFTATISTKSTPADCIVNMLSCEGESVEVGVAWKDILLWNQPTRFPPGPQKQSTVMFEDAIVSRYHDVITRMKINEIALALAPIVQHMDFDAAIQERRMAPMNATNDHFTENRKLLRLQVDALKKVRRCMDMIHHVQMGKDPKRLCVPDVGRLATNGQWHCHGMASVFAALLLPFADALGIEVRYRDGFYYNPAGRDGEGWNGKPRQIADHTWLEVTFFPSGIPYVTDPSFTDNGEGVVVAFEDAYSTEGRRFPVRNLTSGGIMDNKTPVDANHSLTAPLSHLLSAAEFA